MQLFDSRVNSQLHILRQGRGDRVERSESAHGEQDSASKRPRSGLLHVFVLESGLD